MNMAEGWAPEGNEKKRFPSGVDHAVTFQRIDQAPFRGHCPGYCRARRIVRQATAVVP
jgi:hypothetical protein